MWLWNFRSFRDFRFGIIFAFEHFSSVERWEKPKTPCMLKHFANQVYAQLFIMWLFFQKHIHKVCLSKQNAEENRNFWLVLNLTHNSRFLSRSLSVFSISLCSVYIIVSLNFLQWLMFVLILVNRIITSLNEEKIDAAFAENKTHISFSLYLTHCCP